MIEIRPARADEVHAAHALELLCYPPEEAASLERFLDRQARFSAGFLLLVEDGVLRSLLCAVRTGIEDLGAHEIKAEGGHDPAGRDLVILSVATAPAHQRRGLAGRLLDALSRLAPELGVARIRLVCKAGKVAFYARHGFRHVGPSTSQHGGAGASWEEMERAA